MYATKPLSRFKSHPGDASLPPPDGRNSGYLVVNDSSDDDADTCCWGQCGGTRVRALPFPQNRVLTVRYTEYHGESSTTYTDAVVFVPVVDTPLASNRYYPVIVKGKHKGLVRACSKEEEMTTCCFCLCINDVKPRPFDPSDIYQQIEIIQHGGRFTARAVAGDGFPYFLYRKKYWRVYASKPKKFDLGEALGLNHPLRSRQLEATAEPTPATAAVGRWYCPFFFIQDGVSVEEQVDRAMFYEIVLDQHWEAVHGADHKTKSMLESKRVLLGGTLAARQEAVSARMRDGYVWFRAVGPGGQRVGVCMALWERMRWEEYSGGWVDEEEVGKMFGGNVLVERFVVRRMDGSVVVSFDFVHVKKIRAKEV